ncbi:hypothetical protein EII29_00150 [Leptotrichia sp. OH3620_COT-345]|uniref:hypothetical protein n=1 Tax=Leptotrichia sp. OH3620_COT-345 TaxID=2491048 RepID=UPI000F6490CE|nr:hypothetical protein [Leptotrichia sp. OH3620_COT-345]RRD40899.1 hypothetical protein EII29_00150 [Leptotrichia sp. OH3620_COT-345]
MEIFTSQIDLIRKMGFSNWIGTYPVNPLTIVTTVLIIGFIVLIVNAKVKKNNAKRNKVEGAALVILKKQNSFNNDFAEQVRVMEVNGKKADCFFYKTRPAIYLDPGKNELIVYAEWAQSIQKFFKTKPEKINLNLNYNTVYTLYYIIETQQYLLCKGDRYEREKWENFVNNDDLIIG